MVYFLFAHYKVSLPPFTFVGETVTQQTDLVSEDAIKLSGYRKKQTSVCANKNILRDPCSLDDT